MLNLKKAKDSAINLLNDFGYSKPGIPVEKVAAYLGAAVTYSPLDDELCGMVCVKDGKPVIGINSLHHPNRQRFTLAHEIGHLVLHKKEITNKIHVDSTGLMRNSASSKGTNKLEIEANQFAAVLLMPRNLVIEATKDMASDFEDGDDTLEDIAKKFGVSQQALVYRMRDIMSELYTERYVKKKTA